MKTSLKLAGFLFVFGSVLTLISCSKDNGYGSSSNNNGNNTQGNSVSMANMAFSPSSLSVKAGTTVTWSNDDTMDHTVTADDGSFDSGAIKAGAKYSHTYSTAGTFAYHCTLHSGMKGSVTVSTY